jgi:hypothetical protein
LTAWRKARSKREVMIVEVEFDAFFLAGDGSIT